MTDPSEKNDNDDRTGLCTVREWAKGILDSGIRADFAPDGFVPSRTGELLWGSMMFEQGGKRYHVETVITGIEDMPSEEEVSMVYGYGATEAALDATDESLPTDGLAPTLFQVDKERE